MAEETAAVVALAIEEEGKVEVVGWPDRVVLVMNLKKNLILCLPVAAVTDAAGEDVGEVVAEEGMETSEQGTTSTTKVMEDTTRVMEDTVMVMEDMTMVMVDTMKVMEGMTATILMVMVVMMKVGGTVEVAEGAGDVDEVEDAAVVLEEEEEDLEEETNLEPQEMPETKPRAGHLAKMPILLMLALMLPVM